MNAVKLVDQTFLYIIGLSSLILVLITGAMIYFVVHYRRSKHPVAADIRGNWILETIWTIIPTLLALSMFYFGWQSYLGLRAVPDDAIEFEILAQQFSWIIVYPNGSEVYNELVVPQNKPVKLKVTSLDVVHSLFIPAYRIKVDAVGGLDTHAWFYADRLGTFDIECAEFCGTGHSSMLGKLKVVPNEEYEAYLSKIAN